MRVRVEAGRNTRSATVLEHHSSFSPLALTYMPQCIFCLEEADNLTDEHVFPAALGGVLTVNQSVCVECNNGSSMFEQPLATEFAPIRLILQIPDRYGQVPQVPATVRVEEKVYDAKVKGDGKVQLKRIVTEGKTSGGEREFIHQFLTEKQKQKLRQEVRAKGHQFIESGPGNPVQAEVSFGGDLKFIGSPEGLRTASKIAYVGLAFRAGCALAKSDSFAEIRAYIRKGAGEPRARLFVHEGFLEACQQGPHQHSIIMAGRHDKKRVDVIVRLFGGICYFVVLSDHYEGADFVNTLVYDAYRGEVNDFLLAHEQAEILQTEEVATSAQTVWDDVAAAGRNFCGFLDRAIRARKERSRE